MIRAGRPPKPRVGLDADGVLRDFQSAMVEVINAALARAHTVEEWTEYEFEHAFALSPSERKLVVNAMLAERDFVRNMPALPHLDVEMLRNTATVYCVTAPWPHHPTWVADTYWWLREHFDFHHDNVLPVHDKWLINLDWLVDDKVKNLELWQQEHPKGHAVLWETRWNAHERWSGRRTNSTMVLQAWVEEHALELAGAR